jgi:curved DNA-binding protein CbpA
MTRSHYEVLDVPDWATRDQIHRAYLRLARQAHPDAGGTEATMRELNAAWTVLGDPLRRRAYDRTIGRDRVFVATPDGPVHTGTDGTDPDVDLDDRPLRAPSPRLPIMAVVPVATFAASVALYSLGIVFTARHFLAAAAILFIAASLMMIALPFAQMTRSRRR